MATNRHKEIRKAFEELTSLLDEKRDQYLEKISNVINKALKNYKDKDLWKQSCEDIVDLVYAALTDVYLETSITIKKVYIEVSDEIPNIEDFIYKDDNKTLSERIEQYWNNVTELLKNPQTDTKEISLYLLTMYDRILTNEMINVKQGIKKVKKPILQEDEILCVTITPGSCDAGLCPGEEIFCLEEDLDSIQWPPYHPCCDCDGWWDPYNTTDDEDLEELQEAGWEEDDG